MINQLFDSNFRLLEASMDIRMARQNVIASNIANADTPGYRALDVNFEEALQTAADRLRQAPSSDSAMANEPNIPMRLVADDTRSIGNESNTVNLEREMAKLSQNALLFRAQTIFLSKKLTMLRTSLLSGQP